MEQRRSGTVEQWYSGIVVQRYRVVQWSRGEVEQSRAESQRIIIDTEGEVNIL